MDQVKIGKFIAKTRKEKNMTQEQLAQRLGVNSRTISRWENGNYMPDLSLLNPLSKILDISINELLYGEKIEKNNYQEIFEENVVNTIDYSNNKVVKYINTISALFIVFGLVIVLTASTIFPSESSWGSLYMCLGCLMIIAGIKRFIIDMSFWKKFAILGLISFLIMSSLIFIDYINVKNNKVAPRFRVSSLVRSEVIIYQGFFYNAYSCNKEGIYYVDKEANINDFEYYNSKCKEMNNEEGDYNE